MSNKKDEALLRALEALEEIHPGNMTPMAEGNWSKALTAIREALAEPAQQQEPVGEVYRHGKDSHGRQWHGIHWYDANVNVPTGTKLYTSPQPSKPLTDEQIEQCLKQAYATVQGRNLEHAFARAIEQAHGVTGESK